MSIYFEVFATVSLVSRGRQGQPIYREMYPSASNLKLSGCCQERILSHVLARMPGAEDAFEDNAGLFGKIGFRFSPSAVVQRARQIRSKHPNLMTITV